MANEDSRDNSVVGGALKLAAIGAGGYAAFRGGRGFIKHYDDLGETFLGGVGTKMSGKIDSAISAFDKSDGTNSIRTGLDNAQGKILDKDFEKSLKAQDKLLNNADLEMSDDVINQSHEEYKNANRRGKRSLIRENNEITKNIHQNFKDSEFEDIKDYVSSLDIEDGSSVEKGTRAFNLNNKKKKIETEKL